MRGVGLTLIVGCVLACAAPPPTAARSESEAEPRTIERATRVEPEPVVTREADPVLARVRSGVRGGRVPDVLRRELVASANPDHRHAARLLQAIADEVPADVLARSGEHSSAAVELASADELFDAEPDADVIDPVAPPTELAIEPATEAEPVDAEPSEPPANGPVERDELVDRPPKLSTLPPESPAWWWFASGLVDPEQDGEQAPLDPNVSLETLLGPLPLLLRERPPIADTPTRPIADGPRLVILTTLSVRSTADGASLELAGAGSVRVAAQPLPHGRVRLWMIDAGAVPGFLSARPTAPGITVIDVARRDRRLEIEVELGHGWTLRGATTLENGASVEFARIPDDASPGQGSAPG